MDEPALSSPFDHNDLSQSLRPPPNDDLMEIDAENLETDPLTQYETDTPMEETDLGEIPADEFELNQDEVNALTNCDLASPCPKRSSLQASLHVNTVQPDIKRFFSSTKSTNIPSVPQVSVDKATNVGTFVSATSSIVITPTKKDLKSPPVITDKVIENTRRVPIRTNSKQEITCRFKIRIEGGTCNLPLLVKQVVKLYRGVDPSLSILPIQDTNDDSFIIDNEDAIPETEEELKQWVTYVIPQYERVHFTMRFSIMKSIHSISGPIFAWMKLNRSYVKMDTIRSDKILTLGFFEGFHPDFQSRDKFKQYCMDHITSKTKDLLPFTSKDFSIYPRSVYVGSTMEKVTTRALVIEVSADHSSSVLSSLSTSFSGMYSGVTFVPFTKMDDDYQVVLKMAMLKQNRFLHTLKRKQIKGLVNPHALIKKKDGQELTLCQWLQSARNESDQDSQIIQSVEATRYSTSSILYFEEHTENVLAFCKNLKSNMEEHFPTSSISTVFTDTYSPMPTTISRMITDEETTWASIIKRKYLPNPQDDLLDPTQPHTSPPCPNSVSRFIMGPQKLQVNFVKILMSILERIRK